MGTKPQMSVASEELRLGGRPRAIVTVVARGRALLRYPLYTAHVRRVAAKVPATAERSCESLVPRAGSRASRSH